MITKPATAEVQRPSLGRRVICYAAIVSALPYLVLKTLWVAGVPVGITDPELADDPSLLALNTLTLAMDAVAIVLAVVFTYPFGQRLPAWLVLLPIFVGCGLLGPIVVGVPVAVVATVVVRAPSPQDEIAVPVAEWVVPLVYTGFVVLGVLLTAAFVLYARQRWPEVFEQRTPRLTAADRGFAVAGTVLALTAAVLLLIDVFQPSEVAPAAAAMAILRTLLALAAVAGVWSFSPPGGRKFAAPMLAAWFGSSALLAWGGWTVVNLVGDTALVAEDSGWWELPGGLAQLLGGGLLAVVLVRALRTVTRGSSAA